MSSASEASLINAALQAGLFDRELLNRLRVQARTSRQSLLETLSRELALPRTAFYLALAQVHGLPYAQLDRWQLDVAAAGRLPAALIRRHPMVPMRNAQDQLVMVVSDPGDSLGLDSARRLLAGNELSLAVADPEALAPLLARFAPVDARDRQAEDPVGLFDRLVHEAMLRRASDIHIECEKDCVRVRLRVDGRLQPWGGALDKSLGDGMISRIKVLAGMDIAESRAPQDGGLNHTLNEHSLEMRVASIPTKFGERLTLRVMRSDPGRQSLDSLGMLPAMIAHLRDVLAHPHGIVLVSGPTGSGKSTTLYALLRELDAHALNIMTAEDPIEQVMPAISQVQVGGKVSFADALRSFLRHDPDVILVGEIRDRDTADVALKAATTGHMVLSTLHTNTAPGAITRLQDIGCERFMIAATLQGVIAQRLVRRLCTHCCQSRPATEQERSWLRLPADAPALIAEPVGCPRCLASGYRGRIGIFEALWVDEALAEAIAAGTGEGELGRSARHYWRLADDARHKVLQQQTSLAEVQAYLRSTS